MSYKVLARKWRPKQFNEVLGQEHIIRTLKNSVLSQKIGHAYLLTGTRGIGKTTVARIFAKAIRCENLTPEGEPCLTCQSCVDIESQSSINYIEIDGASNNSVENIRDLIESVHYLPSSGKYKVYVIDEVHMLSVSAFNALLKTLEEPPAHVVFIFATTDPQKLLGTVLSRCQRFDYKNSTVDELVSHIKNIAGKEGFQFENEKHITEIARQARGSVRDALSLMDQVLAFSENNIITEDVLNLSLGLVDSKTVTGFLSLIFKGDQVNLAKLYKELVQTNIDLNNFCHQLLEEMYQLTMEASAGSASSIDGIEQLSVVELMWIYENLSKDLDWSLNSLHPSNNVNFSLVKMAVREQIVNPSNSKVEIKKNSNIEEITQEEVIPEVQNEPEAVIKEKTWEAFLTFLYEKSKSIAMNLERGNLISELDANIQSGIFSVAFGQDCKIFFDFLNDSERKMDLKVLLAEFFEVNISNLELNFQLLGEKEKEETNFKSSLEIQENQIKERKDSQRNEILNSKYIKEAENLFDSKINKVILNEDNS